MREEQERLKLLRQATSESSIAAVLEQEEVSDQNQKLNVSTDSVIYKSDLSDKGTMALLNQRLISKEQFTSAIRSGEVSSEIIKAMTEEGSEVVFLTRVDNNEKVAIPTIQFEFDVFDLSKKDDKLNLDNLAGFLRNNQNLYTILGGHTDSIGRKSYNTSLSFNRAQGVKSYLLGKGVNEDQVYVIPRADSIPILSHSSFMGRKVNRRVGMTFIDINDPIYQYPPFNSFLQSINLEIHPLQDYITPFVIWSKMPVSVHFIKNNASYLTDYSSEKLDLLINFLNMVPYRLIITGFMDPDNEENELNLGLERARTVTNYLSSNGVPESKIISIENENFIEYFNVLALDPGISRRRVQFFLIRN